MKSRSTLLLFLYKISPLAAEPRYILNLGELEVKYRDSPPLLASSKMYRAVKTEEQGNPGCVM